MAGPSTRNSRRSQINDRRRGMPLLLSAGKSRIRYESHRWPERHLLVEVEDQGRVVAQGVTACVVARRAGPLVADGLQPVDHPPVDECLVEAEAVTGVG